MLETVREKVLQLSKNYAYVLKKLQPIMKRLQETSSEGMNSVKKADFYYVKNMARSNE